MLRIAAMCTAEIGRGDRPVGLIHTSAPPKALQFPNESIERMSKLTDRLGRLGRLIEKNLREQAERTGRGREGAREERWPLCDWTSRSMRK